jgi:hypothetical protein
MCPLQTADVFPKNGNYRRTGRVYQDWTIKWYPCLHMWLQMFAGATLKFFGWLST